MLDDKLMVGVENAGDDGVFLPYVSPRGIPVIC